LLEPTLLRIKEVAKNPIPISAITDSENFQIDTPTAPISAVINDPLPK
jgi:hypothetical protein